jgi:hypothetical protein
MPRPVTFILAAEEALAAGRYADAVALADKAAEALEREGRTSDARLARGVGRRARVAL